MNCKLSPIASVVISTWQRRALLRGLLFSLARQILPYTVEIIVADSESTDGTAAMVKEFSRRVRRVDIVHTENALAVKRNAGARAARGGVIVFLDDDLLMDGVDTLRKIIEESLHAQGPVCFRVSYPPPWIAASNYYRFKQMAHDQTNSGPELIAPYRFVAMAFCIRRSQFEASGGFCEDFRTYGGEDHAFEFALRRIAINSVLSRSASVVHLENSRTFLKYGEKLVGTSRDAMPMLFRKYPEARKVGSALLESRSTAIAVGVVPDWLLKVLFDASAYLVDRLPIQTPRRVLRACGRIFQGLSYYLGKKQRMKA